VIVKCKNIYSNPTLNRSYKEEEEEEEEEDFA